MTVRIVAILIVVVAASAAPALAQDLQVMVPAADGTALATDVYPDGRSMLVLDGVQRARSRCANDRECLLTPGEPVAVTVELWSTPAERASRAGAGSPFGQRRR